MLSSVTSRQIGICAGILSIGLVTNLLIPSANVVGAAPASSVAATSDGKAAESCSFAEHRYRIRGKLRLALFWIGLDDLGTARMSWQSDGHTTTLMLLAGSDPQRAPRRVNQWGYVREQVASDRATVFALRSAGAANPAFRQPPVDRWSFSAACSSIADGEVATAVTNVKAGDLTYRMLDRALDRIIASPRWEQRRTPRPAGVDAGFLTAMLDLMGIAAAAGAGGSKLHPSTRYIYNGAVYDLTIRETEPERRTTIGTRTFDGLRRATFSLRDPKTKDVTHFSVTFLADSQHPLPVQILYQPSFWLSVELRLDDQADPPPDPAADPRLMSRIRTICGNAGR